MSDNFEAYSTSNSTRNGSSKSNLESTGKKTSKRKLSLKGSNYSSRRYGKRKNNPESSSRLVSGLFILSLILFYSSYFFTGYINSSITSTKVEETITNELNGVEYEYYLTYYDYDYTKKISQLESLRNVFTLESFNNNDDDVALLRVPDPAFFLEGAKYHDDSYIIGKMIEEGLVHLQQSRFEVGSQGYSYYYLYADVIVIPREYYYTYQNYVNSSNVLSWVDYQKRLINEGEQWYYDIVKAIKIINAPLIWISNFIYDLGVIVNFIVNW